jgi:signal recognition particle GTPase
MKETFDLRITDDGSIEGIYQDGLASVLGAEEAQVCRASNVEWEDVGENCRGWTVRAAHDNNLAIRSDEHQQLVVSRDLQYALFYFQLRDTALEWEVKFFWQLLEKDPVPNPNKEIKP